MPKIEITNAKGLVQKTGKSIGGGAGLLLKADTGSSASAELKLLQTTITIGAAASTGTSSTAVVPAGFIALAAQVEVTDAATNVVTIADIGTDADPDCFIDGASLTANAAGDKGFVSCNGAAAVNGDAAGTGRALETSADKLELVLSGAPGGDGFAAKVTLIGLALTSS